MISLPRPLLTGLAGLFASYSIVLGVVSALDAQRPARIWAALALYTVCFLLSVTVGRRRTVPAWVAGLSAGSTLAIALLCSSVVKPLVDGAHNTWYVGALGCLLVVVIVRGQSGFAWFGAALLVAQTFVWAGVRGLTDLEVLGDVLWVTVAAFAGRSLARATRDVQQFARAEREAVEYQAAQDAHHFERQVRLTQTSRVALPMLRRIAETEGDLDEADRTECRVLEQTIRDEIRGRRLLNDAVREQVIAARRRCAFVQVLDDGGLDDVDPALMEPVLDQVAAAIAGVASDRIIIRTAPRGSAKAVTVVGISIDPTAAALGLEDEGEEVDVWLELDRPGVAVAAAVAAAR